MRLIPSAAIGLAPHTATLVNIQTIMWVDAPKSQTLPAAQILGRRVVITIKLAHVSWTFGDGSADRQGSAGKPYDAKAAPCSTRECPGYYGHQYAHTGSVTVSATASWTASFTVDGGAPITIPGDIAGPTARVALQVKQAHSILVPDGH